MLTGRMKAPSLSCRVALMTPPRAPRQALPQAASWPDPGDPSLQALSSLGSPGRKAPFEGDLGERLAGAWHLALGESLAQQGLRPEPADGDRRLDPMARRHVELGERPVAVEAGHRM